MSPKSPPPPQLRQRKPRQSVEKPPVPPKCNDFIPLEHTAPPHTSSRSKPLPPVPFHSHDEATEARGLEAKPLPRPPSSVNLRTTCYWIVGFCLWFLLIVLLLPVITEKDAMPRFNQWVKEKSWVGLKKSSRF
ncbi:hypothetical protein J1614_000399 [Plenodomus biglobosus]|nr:hypothetical protein J1614_000399 [Plenodomus biglobosus]